MIRVNFADGLFFGPQREYKYIERGDNAHDCALVVGDMRKVCAPMHKYADQAIEEAIADGSMPAKKRRGKSIALLRRSKRKR